MSLLQKPTSSSIRAILLGITLVVITGVVVPFGLSSGPGGGFRADPSFLEEWWKAGQGKGLVPWWTGRISAPTPEAAAVETLIADHANPLFWNDYEISELSSYVLAKSAEYKMSPLFVLSLIEVESGYRRGAISSQGAVGLLQLQPATAEMVAQGSGINWHPGMLVDPKINIDLGLRYMRRLHQLFDYNTDHTLAAYNIGPHKLRQRLNSGGGSPVQYRNRVMSTFQKYQQKAKLPRERRKLWARIWL